MAKWEYSDKPMHSEHRRTGIRWLVNGELAAIGISAGAFHMSAGIESAEDLNEDLEQALKACQ